MGSKIKSSEVHAYVYIKNQLKVLGWDARNPARNSEGEVYTQNECLQHPEMKKALKLDRPENVVKLSEKEYWVIEAKPEHDMLEKALDEAKQYADKINSISKNIKALIVTGIAGNDEDTYLLKHRYWTGKKYIPITVNEKEPTGLLSKELTEEIIRLNTHCIKDVPFIPESVFLQKAESVNEILHNGGINLNLRARYIAALILCYAAKTMPNIDNEPKVLIDEINARVDEVLDKEDKPEFSPFIKLSLPTKRDNHLKIKNALVRTFQELNNLNIRSAMNSSTDVLGKFYEVFLKYGNGAKEIGIVLTPRHITEFIAEVLNITHNDYVYDPCCGTGGFLIASFDQVRKHSTETQTNRFKKYNLFGIDQDEPVIALSIVNMIFRGDGKTNIREGNCFSQHLISTIKDNVPTAYYSTNKSEKKVITKVLMNPPFALKTKDEKEYKFVQRALEEMDAGGILFSIFPISVMIERSVKIWRENQLLKNNTLLSVITFPPELFYPIGVHTLGIFIKKGIPHPKEQKVLWIRAINDGFLKKKGKRLRNDKIPDDLTTMKNTLKAFIMNQDTKVENIPEFQKATPINFNDKYLELIPEAYLDQRRLTQNEIEKEMKKMIRETAAFIIRSEHEGEFL